MAQSLMEMRKARAKELERLTGELNKMSSGGGGEKRGDERFWQPTVDKSGVCTAIIRFLPAPFGEDFPFIRYWDHGFKGPGGQWYIENSLTSIDQDDPVSEMNTKLWQEGEGSHGRKIVQGQGKDKPGSKRRLHYISNILVIKDSAKPENNGKVFLYKYGAKIFDKISALTAPEFEDQQPKNPFDPDVGMNFTLRIKNVEGYRNYDSSTFGEPTPIAPSDDEIEAILKQIYPLKDFLDPKNFKSYSELKAKLERVMGDSGKPTFVKASDEQEKVAAAPRSKTKPAPSSDEINEDDDEAIKFFTDLVKEDA